MEHVEIDEYWRYWVDGDGTRFRLRINYAERGIYNSEIVQFTYHELLGHCAQLHCWQQKKIQGQMSRLAGIVTVHGPEQFTLEGLAHTLPLFIQSESTNDPIVRARVLLENYRLLVMNNIHRMINTGSTLEECLALAKKWLPFLYQKRIYSQLKSRSVNPVFRSYEYVYGTSADFFLGILEQSSPERAKDILKRCYRECCVYADLEPYMQNAHP